MSAPPPTPTAYRGVYCIISSIKDIRGDGAGGGVAEGGGGGGQENYSWRS
jgi:hypothetical protein